MQYVRMRLKNIISFRQLRRTPGLSTLRYVLFSIDGNAAAQVAACNVKYCDARDASESKQTCLLRAGPKPRDEYC